MEKNKEKENAHEQPLPVSLSHLIKKTKIQYPGPRRRSTHKKRPLTIKGSLDANAIKLKVTALPEDWGRLEDYLSGISGEDFVNEFFEEFINPALESFRGKALKGKHKSQYWLTKALKDNSSILFPFLSYWCKKPSEKHPEYLKKLIKKAEEDDYGSHIIKKNNKYSANGLTEYCVMKLYGNDAKRLGLSPFDDSDNFYKTYILGNKRAARFIKLYMEGRTQQGITNLAYTLPTLNAIFESLGLF